MYNIYHLKQTNKIELYQNYKRNIVTISKEALNPLEICVGYKGGNYDLLIRNISNIYPLILHNHKGSSIENVRKLIKGECDICICQLDTAVAAKGEFPFTKPNDSLRFVCNLFLEVATLIVNRTSGISNWKQLKGKTVCFGKNTYSSYYNFLCCKNCRIKKMKLR